MIIKNLRNAQPVLGTTWACLDYKKLASYKSSAPGNWESRLRPFEATYVSMKLLKPTVPWGMFQVMGQLEFAPEFASAGLVDKTSFTMPTACLVATHRILKLRGPGVLKN